MHARFLRFALLLLASSLGCVSSWAQTAEEPRFSDTLTATQQEQMGLPKLNSDQLASLNAQIARERALARRGDTIAFAGTFTSRRPSSEHAAAGLDTLTAEERAALDAQVATLLAQRPLAPPPRSLASRAADVEMAERRGEWHGQVTAVYGWGGGSEFYGGSLTTVYESADKDYAIGLSLSRFEGDGRVFHRAYGPCYPRGPFGW